MPKKFDTRIIVLAALGMAAACAANGPSQQMTNAEASVRAAQEVGAPDHPRAAYHLKLSQDQIARAKELVDGNRKERKNAELLLVRADADAELALGMAKTADQETEAKTAWARVKNLSSSEE